MSKKVFLNENLTDRRVGMAGDTLRVIYWDRDAESGALSIADIYEAPRKLMIRIFNEKRTAPPGNVDYATVETVND